MIRAPISGAKRIWIDLSVSSAPPTRLSIALFDNIYSSPAEKIFEKYGEGANTVIGDITGLVPHDFVLIGTKEDPRKSELRGGHEKSLHI
jgi:hypothetical protein